MASTSQQLLEMVADPSFYKKKGRHGKGASVGRALVPTAKAGPRALVFTHRRSPLPIVLH